MVLFSANAHPADSPLLVLFLLFHSVLLQLLHLRVPLLAICWFCSRGGMCVVIWWFFAIFCLAPVLLHMPVMGLFFRLWHFLSVF
jgi:hypothetical protein